MDNLVELWGFETKTHASVTGYISAVDGHKISCMEFRYW